MKLFSHYTLGQMTLKNRMVMAPMTRSRAINNLPNDLMVEYYRQRATAGLIITEGVAPSPNGLGYIRIPGIFDTAQISAWGKITDAVHAEGGKIIVQLMHTGRVAHPDNMVAGSRILAPSAIGMVGQMWTDTQGMQKFPAPVAMTFTDIEQAQAEFVSAARNAIAAGFDGVELHGANGYLLDQFINTASNQREDQYGGSIENRNRFALEVATRVAQAIGADRTGIRLSPYGVYNEMEIFKDVDASYTQLAEALGKLKLLYIHIVDHSAQGAPEVPTAVKAIIRERFAGEIIASGGLNKEKAEAILQTTDNLVAFGQAFLANPDLVYRYEKDLPLNAADSSSFFTSDTKGYLDYPYAMQVAEAQSALGRV